MFSLGDQDGLMMAAMFLNLLKASFGLILTAWCLVFYQLGSQVAGSLLEHQIASEIAGHVQSFGGRDLITIKIIK